MLSLSNSLERQATPVGPTVLDLDQHRDFRNNPDRYETLTPQTHARNLRGTTKGNLVSNIEIDNTRHWFLLNCIVLSVDSILELNKLY